MQLLAKQGSKLGVQFAVMILTGYEGPVWGGASWVCGQLSWLFMTVATCYTLFGVYDVPFAKTGAAIGGIALVTIFIIGGKILSIEAKASSMEMSFNQARAREQNRKEVMASHQGTVLSPTTEFSLNNLYRLSPEMVRDTANPMSPHKQFPALGRERELLKVVRDFHSSPAAVGTASSFR